MNGKLKKKKNYVDESTLRQRCNKLYYLIKRMKDYTGTDIEKKRKKKKT